MGWQDDSRATNTVMNNFPHVSCCRDELPLGCVLEKRVKSSGFGGKYTHSFVGRRGFHNPIQ